MFLAYAVYGLKLVVILLDGSFFKAGNGAPRSPEAKKHFSPLALRVHACHDHLMEGFQFFAAATLLCLHFGVNAAVLADYCTFYVLARLVYVPWRWLPGPPG